MHEGSYFPDYKSKCTNKTTDIVSFTKAKGPHPQTKVCVTNSNIHYKAEEPGETLEHGKEIKKNRDMILKKKYL